VDRSATISERLSIQLNRDGYYSFSAITSSGFEKKLIISQGATRTAESGILENDTAQTENKSYIHNRRGEIMNLVFLGPPGAGKGTIANLAKDVLEIPHISTGDLFRAAIKNETKLGKQVKSILASGELVPDSVTVAMVEERFTQDDTAKGFILDGFPRTIAQAESLAAMKSIDHVVNFELDRDLIVKRLSGRRVCKSTGKIYHVIYSPPKVEGIDDETGEPLIQRDDDKEEAILNRLSVYDRQTAPLIDYYKKKGLLRDIDSSGTPQSILATMLTVIRA